MFNESRTLADGSRVVRVNNGDGTGTLTFFNSDGSVALVEQLTDLPIPPPEPPDAIAPLNALAEAQTIPEVQEAAAALRDALIARGVI